MGILLDLGSTCTCSFKLVPRGEMDLNFICCPILSDQSRSRWTLLYSYKEVPYHWSNPSNGITNTHHAAFTTLESRPHCKMTNQIVSQAEESVHFKLRKFSEKEYTKRIQNEEKVKEMKESYILQKCKRSCDWETWCTEFWAFEEMPLEEFNTTGTVACCIGLYSICFDGIGINDLHSKRYNQWYRKEDVADDFQLGVDDPSDRQSFFEIMESICMLVHVLLSSIQLL